MHPYVSEVLDRFPPSRTPEAKQIDITLLATPLSSAPFCTVSLDNDSCSNLALAAACDSKTSGDLLSRPPWQPHRRFSQSGVLKGGHMQGV